jgi:hypothetical protein
MAVQRRGSCISISRYRSSGYLILADDMRAATHTHVGLEHDGMICAINDETGIPHFII